MFPVKQKNPLGKSGFFKCVISLFFVLLVKNKFFFLSRKLPPNSEGSAEHSEAIGASVSTQVKVSYVSVATYPFRHPGTAYSFHFAVFQKKYFSFL